jgi:hypothetical protein
MKIILFYIFGYLKKLENKETVKLVKFEVFQILDFFLNLHEVEHFKILAS